MRILFLSRWYPYPPDNGSRIRVFNLLKALSQDHCLDLISFTEDPSPLIERSGGLDGMIEHVATVPYHRFHPRGRKALLGYFSPYPRSVIDTFSVEMEHRIEEFITTKPYDVVIASQIDMAPYLRFIRHPCTILEELELSGLKDRIDRAGFGYQKLRSGLTWLKLSGYVAGFPKFIRACTVVSEKERSLTESILKGSLPVEIIPNGIDTDLYAGDFGTPESDSLIYSGALTYSANFDAVAYFLTEIYPLIQAEIPQVKLYITGKVEGVPLERLPKLPGVVFTGYLADIRPRVAQSWVSVAPLRVGGGTRLKILESLALGTPVVATSKGAEGLDLTPGVDLCIADHPADFARNVIRILKDRDLRERLGSQGRKTVTEKYSWAHISVRFNQFIAEMAQSKAGADKHGVN